MNNLSPIKTWEVRMDESTQEINGMPRPSRYYMAEEIEELRKRVAILTSMLPRQSNRCDDEECGDGYGCICYTR